jgi:hypothetical protein
MFVKRKTFVVKRGKMDEVLARFRAHDGTRLPRAVRIYTSVVGALDTVAVEAEFESPQEFESFFSGLPDLPELEEAQAKLAGLTVPGGSSEVWRLVE